MNLRPLSGNVKGGKLYGKLVLASLRQAVGETTISIRQSIRKDLTMVTLNITA